jgi:LPXTG-motif cell wall-anchored protein
VAEAQQGAEAARYAAIAGAGALAGGLVLVRRRRAAAVR